MMRKLVYIIGFLISVSCSQSARNSENAPAPEREELKVEDGTSGWREDTKSKDADFKSLEPMLKNIQLDAEITEKLQANYEAQILATKHPEFAEAIKEQLADSSKFNVSLADSIQTIAIEDITFLGEMDTQNDGIFTQKIQYTTIINSVHTQKDSALVVVKRTLIDVDNAVKVNTSFSFEELDR